MKYNTKLGMKTIYAACLSRLGLSQAMAADLHGVRLDTVKSWSCGRRTVPEGVYDNLRALEAEIQDAACGGDSWLPSSRLDEHVDSMAAAVSKLQNPPE